jgi:hypothetical protein
MTGSYEGDLKLQKDELAEQATTVTRLLCQLCESIDKNQVEIMPPAVKVWWNKHKEIDKKRKLEEQIQKTLDHKKKEALNKLTPEERHLLGIYT